MKYIYNLLAFAGLFLVLAVSPLNADVIDYVDASPEYHSSIHAFDLDIDDYQIKFSLVAYADSVTVETRMINYPMAKDLILSGRPGNVEQKGRAPPVQNYLLAAKSNCIKSNESFAYIDISIEYG